MDTVCGFWKKKSSEFLFVEKYDILSTRFGVIERKV